jgi:hypothetical protein
MQLKLAYLCSPLIKILHMLPQLLVHTLSSKRSSPTYVTYMGVEIEGKEKA